MASKLLLSDGYSRRMDTNPNMDQGSATTVARIPRSTNSRFLAIACLISYTLLAALVVFQNRTIQTQRDLIHLLFKDRQRFNHVNAKAAASGPLAAQSQGPYASSSQAPSSHPSSQAKSEMNSKTKRNSRKTRNRAPAGPPEAGTDPMDVRRVAISI
jgi:hypothetical protein